MITEVRVRDIDYSARYLYPNRSLEIKTSGQSITTPIRAVTSYEYRMKSAVPTDLSIENPISINIESLNHSQFDKFIKTNDFFSQLLRKVEFNNRLAQYSEVSLVLIKPTVTPKRDSDTNEILLESPMNILVNNHNLRDRFIRFIIRIHQALKINPVSIPFLELPFSEFRNIAQEITRSLEIINSEPIFFIDMRYSEFELAIDWLVNHLQSKAIGIYYRPFKFVPLSYEVLSNYIDRDVAFISAQTSRYDSSYEDISTMHYLPFFGNDIYAVNTPPPFFRKETNLERVVRDKLQSIRLFDRESLSLKPIQSAASTIDDYIHEYREDSIVSDILDNYREANVDDAKLTVLRAFTKISELNASSLELTKFQEFIGENSTRDYVQEKQILQRTLQQVTDSQ